MTTPSGVLDTSFIVRYLIGQPAGLAAQARGVIESDLQLGITELGIAETAFVLTSVYKVPREAVVDALIALLQRRNIITLGASREYAVLGLQMCRPSGRISFGDAMIWAVARSRNVPAVYTFDERFPPDGVKLLSRREVPRSQ